MATILLPDTEPSAPHTLAELLPKPDGSNALSVVLIKQPLLGESAPISLAAAELSVASIISTSSSSGLFLICVLATAEK